MSEIDTEAFADEIADLMIAHGPDRHCDGYETIAAKALEWLRERGHVNQWQPIETAPKSGRLILCCVRGCVPDVAKWVTYEGESRWSNDPENFDPEYWPEHWASTRYEPTHWMPLPEPPQ